MLIFVMPSVNSYHQNILWILSCEIGSHGSARFGFIAIKYICCYYWCYDISYRILGFKYFHVNIVMLSIIGLKIDDPIA